MIRILSKFTFHLQTVKMVLSLIGMYSILTLLTNANPRWKMWANGRKPVVQNCFQNDSLLQYLLAFYILSLCECHPFSLGLGKILYLHYLSKVQSWIINLWPVTSSHHNVQLPLKIVVTKLLKTGSWVCFSWQNSISCCISVPLLSEYFPARPARNHCNWLQ